jgi:hypothetical protein
MSGSSPLSAKQSHDERRPRWHHRAAHMRNQNDDRPGNAVPGSTVTHLSFAQQIDASRQSCLPSGRRVRQPSEGAGRCGGVGQVRYLREVDVQTAIVSCSESAFRCPAGYREELCSGGQICGVAVNRGRSHLPRPVVELAEGTARGTNGTSEVFLGERGRSRARVVIAAIPANEVHEVDDGPRQNRPAVRRGLHGARGSRRHDGCC